jgi:PAS domain S-box-containing protein
VRSGHWGRAASGGVISRTTKRAALIFFPLAAAAVAASYLLYTSQASAIRTIAEAGEARIVEVARQRFVLTLGSVVADVFYLADHEALHEFVTEGKAESLDRLGAHYLAFARHRPFFDQISFIDASGNELVQIDRTGGTAALAAPTQRQIDRDYIRQALTLDRGQIFISEMDLNFENGAIQQRVKPIIRIAAPVFDQAGERRGTVIVHYLAERVLDRIKELERQAGEIWLLSSDGIWLLGPGPDAFAFVYPEPRAWTFARIFPDAWQHIEAAPTGQFGNEAGRFTYARADALGEQPDAANSRSQPSWFVVIHTPSTVLAAQTSEIRRTLIATGGGLLLLLGGAAFGLAHHQVLRKDAEQRIRLSEEQFRAVTDTARDAIVSADRNGAIRYFNPSAELMFGYRQAEALDQPLMMLMPERFRQAHMEGMKRYLTSREAKVVGRTVELIARHRDGKEFPIELALASSEVDHDLFFTAIIRDITARVEAERSLRASEARFRDLLQSAPDAVLITDDQGRIQLVNTQTERLFGYRRNELIGQKIEMLLPERYRRQHVRYRAGYHGDARTRPMGAGLELYGLRKDGSEFPVSIGLSPIRTEQGLTVFCDVRDITDQRANEAKIQDLNRRLQLDNAELEAVNKELEAFSYSVSHDLRAPLRAIDGFSQALVEDAGPLLKGEHLSHLTRVRQAAQRMGVLIDDLIKLARVTRTDIRVDDVDLTEIARQIADNLQDSAPERQANFAIAPNLRAEGDPRLLQVALDNLLNNSWKFTAPRSPARIEFGKTEIDGKPAFFVRDNGVGFDMSYAGKMFGAFQRLHDAREFAGTGIGLATVQRIIHKHGGRIWAESQPGKGATFYFTL